MVLISIKARLKVWAKRNIVKEKLKQQQQQKKQEVSKSLHLVVLKIIHDDMH